MLHRRSSELRPPGPFRLDLTAWTLRRRARNTVDRWDGTYRRALLVDGEPATVEVAAPAASRLSVSVTMSSPVNATRLTEVASTLDRMLGLQVELGEFYDMARSDPYLCPIARRYMGVRPPRFPTLFEALANAIANQQLSLEVGIELLNRLTDRYGGAAPGAERPLCAFPSPDAVAGTSTGPLTALGFSTRKAEYLITAAEAIVSGQLDEEELRAMSSTEAVENLCALRGIGRWSAEYVLLRGLGRLDIFPADDVGARNKLERLLGRDITGGYDEIRSITDAWAPYGGLVYFHLLLDGLDERGELPELL